MTPSQLLREIPHGTNTYTLPAVLTDPHGRLLWASPALPGAVHDIKAARTHGIIDALAEAELACWADSDDGELCR